MSATVHNLRTVAANQPVATVAPSEIFPASSALYFPAVRRPISIKAKNGTTRYFDIPESMFSSVCRPSTDPDNHEPVLLGVVGSRYEIIQNKELDAAVQAALVKSVPAEHLRSVKIKEATSRNGAFSRREFSFPSIMVPLRQGGRARNGATELIFRAGWTNTFDGSGVISAFGGAWDLICTNGAYIGEKSLMGRRHTKNALVDVGDFFAKQVEEFYKRSKVWQVWAEKTVTDEQVKAVIAELPGMSDRRAARLLEQYADETTTRGNTVWALYSAMTFFASHNSDRFGVRQTGNDNVAETLDRREHEVRAWVKSPAWQEFAKAA